MFLGASGVRVPVFCAQEKYSIDVERQNFVISSDIIWILVDFPAAVAPGSVLNTSTNVIFC